MIDTGLSIWIRQLILAMGMFSENMERIQNGCSIAYSDSAFVGLASDADIAINELYERMCNESKMSSYD